MVSWVVLPTEYAVEVTFTVEDMATWHELDTKDYGVAALSLPPEDSGNVAELLPSSDMRTKIRRHIMSLPEFYYAVTIDCLLPISETPKMLWEQFTSYSATFAKNYVMYQHFRRLDWIPRPGLNYGAHFVLYRGSVVEFHSEYIVYVRDEGEAVSWNSIQSLTRIAADVKKTVLLCTVTSNQASVDAWTRTNESNADPPAANLTLGTYSFHGTHFKFEAIAIRFWDVPSTNEPHSYMFHLQPALPKKAVSSKKRNRPSSHQKHEPEAHYLRDST